MSLKNKIIGFILILIQTSIYANDTLTVLHHKNYYPYAFIDTAGQSNGVLIDLWKEFGAANNQVIQFVAANEASFVDIINNNEADIIAGTLSNDTFNLAFDYSDYILRVNTVLFLNKTEQPKSLGEIDFPILILNNFSTQQLIQEKYGFLNIELCKNFVDLKTKIESGKYLGFIYDYPNPTVGETKVNVPKGYYSYTTLKEDRLRPAFKKGNTKVRDLYMEGSEKISNESMHYYAKKWNIAVEKTSFVWLYITLLILLCVVLAFFIYALQKQKKQTKQNANFASAKDWQVLIEKGENDYIEFKSSLRWDYRQEKVNKALENVIAKTISAFLNSEGGMLFIGVDDEGKILGLENDYSTISKKIATVFCWP